VGYTVEPSSFAASAKLLDRDQHWMPAISAERTL
jgi:hypothetical protein